jgi:hypothetical protein
MLTTKELPMSKAIVKFGYTDYVMDLKDAVTMAEMLSKAEIYDSKYVAGGDNTHHIYANEKQEVGVIKLISDDFYRMAKLAGKPTD